MARRPHPLSASVRVKKLVEEVLLTAGRPLTENEIHERVERLMAERQTPS